MSVFAAAIRSNQIISISPIHNDSEFDESPVSGYEVVRQNANFMQINAARSSKTSSAC